MSASSPWRRSPSSSLISLSSSPRKRSSSSPDTTISPSSPRKRVRFGSRTRIYPDGSSCSSRVSSARASSVETSDETEYTSTDTLLILAAIYHDIAIVCLNRKAASSGHDPLPYEKDSVSAAKFVDRAITVNELLKVELLQKNFPTSEDLNEATAVRIAWSRVGFRIFAICAWSQAFRQVCRMGSSELRRKLFGLMARNMTSIRTFARLRGLDWRGPLLKHGKHRSRKIDHRLRPRPKIRADHPHEVYIALNKKLRVPTDASGNKRVHIDQSIFRPKFWPSKTQDPTKRRSVDGTCDICSSEDLCDCTLDSRAGEMVELVEYPGKGIGVRSLANFKAGDILGEFAGEICPDDYDDDPVYALVQQSKTDSETAIAVISPMRFGNWTRYINHSCNASTSFERRTVGNRTIMTVEASRDIGMYEEITINYGSDYWKNKTCKCGEEGCISSYHSESEGSNSN
ncbi:hypothetical protein ASPZODRAFT_62153 [Penicilliopsis zonata CBS 506.65]|uniref:SET domain-containing protein n=1 Tax=Penicilliopsis zonata CBS 506.65 TaxID=1073090 RepID=A0A1L9SMK0_9EURO|nr:hypothetical protein ASPZODRAFT_62153 [Penicilliopsis zonata CBS 506.65]OJJ48321.1 hypothetical protein ASPZODRAFT_62153 [Penicilliopsis zonata CBS 506.65]